MSEALKVPPDIFQFCRHNLMSPESSISIFFGTDFSNYSLLIVYFGGFSGGLGEDYGEQTRQQHTADFHSG